MVTDESVKEANLREIAYRYDEEYELCKRSAIYSLLGNSNVGEEVDQVEIDYLDLPSHSLYEKRQLLVKVYNDRYYCPIGGLARHKGEKDYTELRMAKTFGTFQIRYQLFAIQPQPKKDPHLYWVRVE